MVVFNPIFTLVYFINLGIDIATFFLAVRLIMNWRHIQWLASFDKAGNSLVNGITSSVERYWSSRSKKTLSANGCVIIGLGLLTLTKIILSGLLQCFV